MPCREILVEVKLLKELSDRLDQLAGEHPSFTEALLPISAGILRMATVLEVLVISRSGTPLA